MPDEAARRFRGSVARKGARLVASPDDRRSVRDRHATEAERPAWEPEVWVRDQEPASGHATGTAPTGRAARRRSGAAVPEEVQAELADALGRARVERVQQRLADAVKAYERDRYGDALRILRPVADAAPMSATVRELHGLILYRLGRWAAAIRELEAFHALTGSYDQHPVLADCHRAGGHWAQAETVWEDLRQSSPPPEVLAEGRIVMAGVRADQGDLPGAIELLEHAKTKERPPPLHHLRVWYALADLYERAGDLPRARRFFRMVLDSDPSLFDTAERLAALG